VDNRWEVQVAWLQTQTAGRRYAVSAGSVVLLTVLLAQIPSALEHTDIALLYLLAVLISATMGGRGPAIVASVLAFLTSNFFFVSPRYTFTIADPRDLLRLVIFLIVAISTSDLAGRVQQQARIAQARARELAILYSLSQAISAAVDLDRILPMIAETTSALLHVPSCRILLEDAHGTMVTRAAYGADPTPARVIDTVLARAGRTIGMLQITQPTLTTPLTSAQHANLELIANQTVLVVERAQLVQEAGTARSLAESDRLKTVLLASVSHDLRTPLAVIKGAVTTLLDDTVAWDRSTRHELLGVMNEETDRLNRLVGNLLEMSRIEAGALSHTRTWEDLSECIAMVITRLQARLALPPITITLPPDLPLVLMNVTQIDQVLTNLLENAAIHTPPHTPITVAACRAEGAIQITIQDHGPGIPEEMLPHIFERFVRARDPERHAEGSGLGLAIARGLIEAHGGQVWASNAPGGGARFVFTLPLMQEDGSAHRPTPLQPQEQDMAHDHPHFSR
jgi:two-component system sensor histidine kinase KdpD